MKLFFIISIAPIILNSQNTNENQWYNSFQAIQKEVNEQITYPKLSLERYNDKEKKQWIPPNHTQDLLNIKDEYLIDLIDEHEQEIDEDNEKFKRFKSLRNISKSINISKGSYFLVTSRETYLKKSQKQSYLLSANEKCKLEAGKLILLEEQPYYYWNHVKIKLKSNIENCNLTEGYIYTPHIAASSKGGLWLFSPEVRAFMDTIAYAEGTTEFYNIIYGYRYFYTYNDHPRRLVCSYYCSDAAGRYQFLSTTWNDVKYSANLKDFTPPSQDLGALELIRRAYALNDVKNSSSYNYFVNAIYKLNRIWASLPGSPYGQPTVPLYTLWKYYNKRLEYHRKVETYIHHIKSNF